jgi:dihydroneopterin aldolase
MTVLMMIPRSPRRPISEPVWDASRSHVRVVLRDVEVLAAVGLHAWERHPERPSRLIVNVDMYAYSDGPADGAGAAGIIDYDKVRTAIAAWSGRAHVDLLETLTEQLVAVCFGIAAVQACRVSVMKPDIFAEAAAVGVEVFRVRADG